MAEPVKGRSVFNARTTPFLPYDLEGPVQPEMSWLPVSFDRESGGRAATSCGWRRER